MNGAILSCGGYLGGAAGLGTGEAGMSAGRCASAQPAGTGGHIHLRYLFLCHIKHTFQYAADYSTHICKLS